MGMYEKKQDGDRILEEFPGLSQRDLDEVEWQFNQYLFYQGDRNGRQVWTTCCHQDYYIEGYRDAKRLTGTHGDTMNCPFCGEEVKVICMGRLRSGVSIQQYIPFLFLHASEDGQTVWAQGYWTTRKLMEDPTGKTLFMPTRCYRFRPGEWRQWEEDYYGGGMVPCSRKWAQEPFTKSGIYSGYENYHVVGYDCLERSFLRYTGYDAPLFRSALWNDSGKRDDLIRYLAMASLYPKQVEMLRKAGVEELPAQYIYGKRKNADVFRWKEEDPRKAFRLTKPELKAFLQTNKKLELLRMYWDGEKTLTFAQCEKLAQKVGLYLSREVTATAKRRHVPVHKVVRKLLKGWDGEIRGVALAVHLWLDYIDAAEKLGWDLSNPLIQMPRELERKHDEATQAVQLEEDRLENEKAARLYQDLCETYEFSDGAYLIRPAETATEIIQEGKALKHCVGGYAQRHADGVLAILFLRKVSAPDAPYMTIEMKGKELRQIHGYKNDRNGPDPWKLHKDLLETWLAWVKAGSKRDKEGNPRLPKKKEDAA